MTKEALKLALEALNLPSLKTEKMLAQRDEAITAIKKALAQAPVAAAKKDEVFAASIEFIGTLTGMTPPPIEVAPPEVFKPFRDFTEKVCSILATPPQRTWVGLTDEMVVAAARVLNERQADACGVDRDDQWAIYSDDFKADALAMLKVAHGIKGKA